MARASEDGEGECTSPDGTYRYKYWCKLEGELAREREVCLLLMLNPATRDGDSTRTHRTRIRCRKLAQRLGFGMLWTCNLFAYRDPDPKKLRDKGDVAVGPENDRFIREAIRAADMIICAWGGSEKSVGRANFAARVRQIVKMIEEEKTHDEVYALGEKFTRGGHPRHPARLREPLEDYWFRLRLRNGELEAAAGT